MRYSTFVFAGMLGLNAIVAFAEVTPTSAPEDGFPKLPQATLQMPWTDFKTLMKAVQDAAVIQRGARDSKKPPVPWSVGEATYEAKAVDETSVRVEASMTLQVWDDGWVRVPIIGDAVAPTSVALDDKPITLTADQPGWLSLLVQGAGTHSLTLTFFTSCVTHDGVTSMSFPCAQTPVTRVTLRLPFEDALVTAPSASNISVKRDGGAAEATLAFRRTEKIDINWSQPVKLEQAPPPVEPRVASTVWTLTSVTDNYVTCETRVRYRILRGAVSTFQLDIPASAHVLSVNGDGAVWSQSEAEGRHAVEIKINHPITDSCTISVAYDSAFSGDLAEAPLVSASGVVQEDGYVGVAARGNIEISPGAATEGLTRIDSSELPSDVLSQSATPILLAFRHTGGKRLLALSIRRLNDVAVPDSSIDHSDLTTVVTDEGMAVTRATYEMRNSLRQFLRLKLDSTAEVWSAIVGGQPVKPARDDANGDVLIPLAKSSDVNRRLSSFPVELLYAEHVPRAGGWRSDVALTAPAADILSSATTWTVLTPISRWVYSSGGDLAVAEGEQTSLQDIMPAQRRRAATGARHETLHRLREGIERFLITDINNAASSGAAQSPPRYTGQPVAPASVGAAPATASVAGVLPVAIALPTAGVAHSFTRVLVPQGTSLSLVLHTYPGWLLQCLNCVTLGLVVGIGFGGAVAAGRVMRALLRSEKRFAMSVTALTVCVAALIAAWRVYQIDLTLVYWSVAAGSFFTVAPAIGRLRHFMAPKPQDEIASKESVS